MKFQVKKKQLKNISKTEKSIDINLTRQIAGASATHTVYSAGTNCVH
ncbi:hypothetical protein [Pseudoalteromonas luteoviolacea]|uniref:Uncharacterized protein n=1 Tax=Pseudoalteromonas luteoviolacea (strain 2ta16) TaxID=1353533 RepID=V4HW99_PSEL2|nr:hypothetical protein [Pseudoalteromonas luteoviolacea]ESP95095.1 hypothetical protein PL2TA16_04350 [Pseudoalteromonas luteoviolacea 2ta16]KZN42269.1 hypothetical protein N483_12145 [Pseudoalteromonas luteoviolacea NCIMB 1944]